MIKFRWYVDSQKEQEWLNEMSKQGWALKSFFLGFYKFEKSEPGEYIYQIDLLPEKVNKQEYYDFMEETGTQVVCSWFYWVYLRKKASEGNFEMYSDKESLKEHYKKIIQFFTPFMYLELVAALLQLPAISMGSYISIASFILLMFLFIVFFTTIKSFKKRKNLIDKNI